MHNNNFYTAKEKQIWTFRGVNIETILLVIIQRLGNFDYSTIITIQSGLYTSLNFSVWKSFKCINSAQVFDNHENSVS